MREYIQGDIYVAYPENWMLEESEMETPVGSLQLTNDDGAFWLLKKYPFGTNPDEIAKEAAETIMAEYEDMEIDRFDKIIADKTVTGFEMTFFYLDLMNLAMALCYEQDGITYAVFWQTGNQLIVHNGETVPIEKVLEAITHSLLHGPQESHASHHDHYSCGHKH